MKRALNFDDKFSDNQSQRKLSNNMETQALDDETSLCLSAKRGELEKVARLIDKGIDINTKSKFGATPLYLAVENQKFNVAQFLIKKGADMNMKNSEGNPILHRAIGLVNLDITKFMINNGANPDITNLLNESPLHIASKWGYLLLAKLLLGAGANIEVKTHVGIKPLHIAVERGHMDIVRLFTEHGADISNTFDILQTYRVDHKLNVEMDKLLLQTSIVDLLCNQMDERKRGTLEVESTNNLLSKATLLNDTDQNTQSVFSHRILHKLIKYQYVTTSHLTQTCETLMNVLDYNIKESGVNLYFLAKDLNQLHSDISVSSLYNEVGKVQSLFTLTTIILKKFNLWDKATKDLPCGIADKLQALEKVKEFLVSSHITLVPQGCTDLSQQDLTLMGMEANGSDEIQIA